MFTGCLQKYRRSVYCDACRTWKLFSGDITFLCLVPTEINKSLSMFHGGGKLVMAFNFNNRLAEDKDKELQETEMNVWMRWGWFTDKQIKEFSLRALLSFNTYFQGFSLSFYLGFFVENLENWWNFCVLLPDLFAWRKRWLFSSFCEKLYFKSVSLQFFKILKQKFSEL